MDELTGYVTDSPYAFLSSSQVNAVAVCIFLAFNLGIATLPLKAAMLDDPFQSLDDIHLLGLVDLLRRFGAERQLLISTHESRFASLLQRKLRPLSEGRRAVVLALEGWSRNGPHIRLTEVPADRQPFKIAA
jgi:ABC-type cobalamin/Fe3+-siderophores transport system ATPase subunit